jgi:hypothetical protein
MEAATIANFAATLLPVATYATYDSVLTPSSVTRTTFELRISRTHIKLGLPAYNLWWIDTDMTDLGWTRGVVQLGHHSYTPEKDCQIPGTCHANTWHWDNVSISSAVPFTILRADRRVVDARQPTAVTFPAAAPVDSFLRFAGFGNNVQISTNGGSTWQAAQIHQSSLGNTGHFQSYWTPIVAGTQSVMIRGTDAIWPWTARDISIWSQTVSAPASISPSAAPSIVPSIVPSVASSASVGKIGDVNGDGKVNIADLSYILSKWNTADTIADLNKDGKVNINDLSILLSNWGK